MKLLKNPSLLWLVLPLAAFWIVAPFVDADILIAVMNWAVVAVAAAVCVAFAPIVVESLKTGTVPRYAHFGTGIFLAWLSVLMARSWIGLIRALDAPSMAQSKFVAFYVYTAIIAGVFHLTAPGAVGNMIPTRQWIVVGVSVGIGIMIGLIFSVVLTPQVLASLFNMG